MQQICAIRTSLVYNVPFSEAVCCCLALSYSHEYKVGEKCGASARTRDNVIELVVRAHQACPRIHGHERAGRRLKRVENVDEVSSEICFVVAMSVAQEAHTHRVWVVPNEERIGCSSSFCALFMHNCRRE